MKLFNLKQYSFSTKVIFAFLIFLLVFMLIRTSLSIPKIEKESLEKEIEYITKSLLLLQEQLKIIGKSLKMQRELEIKLSKEKILNELVTLSFLQDHSKYSVEIFLKNSRFARQCSYKFISNDFSLINIKTNDYFSFNKTTIINKWQENRITTNNNKNYRPKTYYFYNYQYNKNLLSLACYSKDLNPGHKSFEKSLKEHIHRDLLVNSNLSGTKTAFVWISPSLDKNDTSILYENNKEKRKTKYNVSKLSNIKNIPTGTLTTKEIFEASQTNKPLVHTMDGKEVFTWIINLSSDPLKPFFIINTINKQEIENKHKAKLLFLLPESLIAIGISFILLLILFRRILKNIDTLTQTATLVNKGKKNIRSNVTGDDDIGTLGKSFDRMLDFFENNIETLDKKVEAKTKEISKSLEEKEILLKEIHHRVKNNLALTISLIELQSEEIPDQKTKKALLDISERIYTMELLHRKLYESDNLNEIPFKTYVIDLTQAIAKTYDINKELSIKIEMEAINLNIETAMPYGLILNELITNAFKYAAKDTEYFLLQINIMKINSDELQIIIQDNGEGLKEEFHKICNETLGLKLINMIIKFQVNGTISYEYDHGAKFIIRGKIKEIHFKE